MDTRHAQSRMAVPKIAHPAIWLDAIDHTTNPVYQILEIFMEACDGSTIPCQDSVLTKKALPLVLNSENMTQEAVQFQLTNHKAQLCW